MQFPSSANLNSNRLVRLFGLLAALSGVVAEAKPVLEWHWASSGSSGSPGGEYIAFVIDGWHDDPTSDPNPQRFPNGGMGGGTSQKSSDAKIKYPDGKGGCTIVANSGGIRGLPKSTKTWSIFMDPGLDEMEKIAIDNVMTSINVDQIFRGNAFKLKQVWDKADAQTTITYTPTGVASSPFNGVTTGVITNRSGYIRRSYVFLDYTLTGTDYDAAFKRAARFIGQSLGLQPLMTNDTSYPTVMSMTASTDATPAKVDACTLAAISRNVN